MACNKTVTWRNITLLLCITLFVGCTQKSPTTLSTTPATDPFAPAAPTAPPPPINTGTTVGNVAGTGSGTSTVTPTNSTQYNELNAMMAATQPVEEPPVTVEQQALVTEIQQAEAAGEDTTALRYEMGAQIIEDCLTDVAQLAPQPGENIAGLYTGICDTGETLVGQILASYPSSSGGFPTGLPTIYSAAVDTTGEAYAFSLLYQLNPEGDFQGLWVGNYGTYIGDVIQQPQAATVYGFPVTEVETCYSTFSYLVQPTNPSPGKYIEAMNRLSSCYLDATIWMSPILYEYVYNMDPTTAAYVTGSLYL